MRKVWRSGDDVGVSLVVPAGLRAACAEDGRGWWLDEVGRLVPGLAQRWGLRLGQPLEPGGRTAWLCAAIDRSGQAIALKVGWRHVEAEHEAEGLAAWGGEGAVRVHRVARFEHSIAMLLERCRPGRALTELPEDDQDVVVAGLLRRLRISPPSSIRFRSLAAMCEAWADETERTANLSGNRHDRGLLRDGLALLRSLSADVSPSVLLATDLHAANVLAAEREPWLMIDPKPHVGDPAFDGVQHLLNSDERLHVDPRGLAQRMGDLLEVDGDRLLGWLFARCVQESVNHPDLGDVARRLTAV